MRQGSAILIFFVALLATAQSFANFTYEGYLTDLSGNSISTQVQIRLEIEAPASGCLLYRETHTLTPNADGYFSVGVGSGTQEFGLTFADIFNNNVTHTTATPCTYNAGAQDDRVMKMYFRHMPSGAFDSLGALTLRQAPMAMSAQNLAGYLPTSLLRTTSGTIAALSPSDVTDFAALLSGNSSKYMKSGGTIASTLPSLPSAPGSPSAGQVWYDSVTNEMKYFNGSTTVILNGAAGGTGTVTLVQAGAGLTGGAITGAGTISLTGTGVTAGSYGSGNFVPTFTVDAQGRLTSAGSTAMNTQWNNVPLGVNYALGSVGIGVPAPVTQLDINGAIKIANDSATCAAGFAGAIRYNGGSLQYCDGVTAGWVTVGVSGSGLQSLNGLTNGTQAFAIGSTGTSPQYSSAAGIHTLNIPMAQTATVTAGLLSNVDYTVFNSGATLANGAQTSNAANTLVRRDGSGNFAANAATLNSLNVFNGGSTVTVTNPLGANYLMVLPPNVGAPGKILSTDGTSNLSWVTPSPGVTFPSLSTTLGSMATPAYSFSNDPDTGIFSAGPDFLNFSTGGFERVTVDPSGNIGVGTTSPSFNFEVYRSDASTSLKVVNANSVSSQYPSISVGNYMGGTNNGFPLFLTENANGSIGSPSPLAINQILGGITFTGYNGSGYFPGAAIQAIVASNYTGSNSSAHLIFQTTSPTSTSATEKMRLTDTGKLGIGTTNPNAALTVNGHIGVLGGSPSFGTCGTGPSVVGNDTRGTISPGAGAASSCDLTFNQVYATPPVCVASWANGVQGVTLGVTTTSSAMTIHFSAPPSGGMVNYICLQ